MANQPPCVELPGATPPGHKEFALLARAPIPFTIRPYAAADRLRVFSMLRILPVLYPGGFAWLEQRLSDVIDGKARCTLAVWGSQLLGIAIESLKGQYRIKLSTLWVEPCYRGIGVGSRLLLDCQRNWIRHDISEAYITMDVDRRHLLVPVLSRLGFREIAMCHSRYGLDRDELVMSWHPTERV
jgi:GNAT superfamily N-acetyltransferase